MKKLSIIAILFLSIVLFSCNNTQTKTNEEDADSTTNEVVETDIEEDVVVKEIPVLEEVTLNIADIKKGDIVEGLTVKSVKYQKGYMYSIDLEGELTVTGKLQYNDFEESTEFWLDENSLPKTSLNVEGLTNPLFVFLAFSNLKQLKSALSKEQLSGSITIQIKNLSIETYIDKGRLGMGNAEFVKVN